MAQQLATTHGVKTSSHRPLLAPEKPQKISHFHQKNAGLEAGVFNGFWVICL